MAINAAYTGHFRLYKMKECDNMYIKQAIQDVLSNNLYLSNLYYKTMVVSQHRMRKQIEYCKKIDSIADITQLQEFRSQFDNDHIFAPARSQEYSLFRMYGYLNGIFGAIPDRLTFQYPTIEHGLFLGNEVTPEVTRMAHASVLTFGAYRKEIIHKYREGMPVFCIGPYLHYVAPYYSEEEMRELKQKLGKTLLVFPAHSIPKYTVTRNENEYYKKIKRIAADFDSVLINVYWWNVNDPMVQDLQAEGYKIVSAGFQYDINFAKRLKTIIQLADLAIGDSIGTHIGFCEDVNVPFRYIDANTKDCECQSSPQQKYVDRISAEIENAFRENSFSEEKQKHVLNYYWGQNCVRTQTEISKILEINKELTLRGRGTTNGYRIASKQLLNEYSQTDVEKFNLLSEAMK